MKNAVLGVLVGVGLLATFVGGEAPAPEAYGQSAVGGVGSAQNLIALVTDLDDREQLTLIDPTTRVMGIYHINRESGKVELKSVRDFRWDLQMVEFNGVSPLPGEIRALLEQR